MTVLSGAYITSNPCTPLFGGVQADVLECLNCPIVKDVLTVDDELGDELGSETLRHKVRCRPPEGCWSSEAKQERSRAVGTGQLHPAAARSGACPCARFGADGRARIRRRP